jgi:hypothetical protein
MTTVYVDLFPKLNSELMGVPLRAALYWRASPSGTGHYAPHLPFAISVGTVSVETATRRPRFVRAMLFLVGAAVWLR